MKGTNRRGVHEWYQFPHPERPDEESFAVHIPFIMSNWNCIFGNGCVGHFGTHEEKVRPDIGCCSHGAYINSAKELVALGHLAGQMTEDELGPKGFKYLRKLIDDGKGWAVWERKPGHNPDDRDDITAKTRVRDGGCIFAKRLGDGDDSIGCAFVRLGNKRGLTDHIETMPKVCWQVPIAVRYDNDEITETTTTTIFPWDADNWGGMDEDGTHDSWMAWNCVDTPDAYTANRRLYRTMERELRHIMGDAAYEVLATYCDSRDANYSIPAPGTVVNGGRPLLPLLVGNRTAKRSS